MKPRFKESPPGWYSKSHRFGLKRALKKYIFLNQVFNRYVFLLFSFSLNWPISPSSKVNWINGHSDLQACCGRNWRRLDPRICAIIANLVCSLTCKVNAQLDCVRWKKFYDWYLFEALRLITIRNENPVIKRNVKSRRYEVGSWVESTSSFNTFTTAVFPIWAKRFLSNKFFQMRYLHNFTIERTMADRMNSC